MNTLNLGSDEIPATKKKSNTRNLKIALGLAAVILVPSIGSTLAGNIAISGAAVEFGQGSVTATSSRIFYEYFVPNQKINYDALLLQGSEILQHI